METKKYLVLERRAQKAPNKHSLNKGKSVSSSPQYLYDIIFENQVNHSYRTRTSVQGNLPIPRCYKDAFKNSFFPSTIKEWNGLAPHVRHANSKLSFKKTLIASYHNCKPLFICSDVSRKKQVAFAQIRMGFSNLNYHLFSHGCIENASCPCGHSVEDCQHFLIDCPLYTQLRTETFQLIQDISPRNAIRITPDTLLFGNSSLNHDQNTILQHYVMNFIYRTGRLQ